MTAAPRRKAAMSAKELRKLMDDNGVKYASDLAERIEVHRNTVARWLAGDRAISKAFVALIFTVLKKPNN